MNNFPDFLDFTIPTGNEPATQAQLNMLKKVIKEIWCKNDLYDLRKGYEYHLQDVYTAVFGDENSLNKGFETLTSEEARTLIRQIKSGQARESFQSQLEEFFQTLNGKKLKA